MKDDLEEYLESKVVRENTKNRNRWNQLIKKSMKLKIASLTLEELIFLTEIRQLTGHYDRPDLKELKKLCQLTTRSTSSRSGR